MTDDDFEKLIEELQHKIEYLDGQKYSKIVIRESKNPSNFGILNDPDTIGKIKGPCGDTMKITLEIQNNRITNACFWTDGCGATIACGSKLTKMIKGKYLRELEEISSLQLIEALEGLPVEHTHCSILAINTLHKAIKNYNKTE
ncbi:iron-sulfur cluster assembly scaffold protein [Thermoplasmatota archaeon]